MYLEIYLFNWTNAEELANIKSVKEWRKPKFEQMGPYTFLEHHSRANIKFNSNGTVSYNTKKTWHFVEEKSKGSLSDMITTLNPIALTMANIVKKKGALIKLAVNTLLKEKKVPLYTTKTASEFLFDGFDDELLDLAKKLHIKDINIPYDKFGWFYPRNESVYYDGNFTMYTGGNDIRKLGVLTLWNGEPRVTNYKGDCGLVKGTTGEIWYPVHDDKRIEIFTSDMCSSITLIRNGSYTKYGIEANAYVDSDILFDNGDKFIEMKCFDQGDGMKNGVRDVSKCKFGAPAYLSLPHFRRADPSYSEAIEGMTPDEKEHSILMALEPNTGLPLQARVGVQANLLLSQIKGISLYENVKTTLMPCLWFKQYADISEDLATMAKTIIILPNLGKFTGYGIMGIGSLIFLIGLCVVFMKGRGTDDEQVLTHNQL